MREEKFAGGGWLDTTHVSVWEFWFLKKASMMSCDCQFLLVISTSMYGGRNGG